MSGLTGYLTQDGIDLSYVFQPKNSIPATNQNFIYSGTNTFSGITTFSELQLSCGTISSSPHTLSNPILNFYHVTSATTTINLPSPTVANDLGTFIIFKHTVSGNITLACSTINMDSVGGPPTTTSVNMTNASVVMVACNGTAWWIYYVA